VGIKSDSQSFCLPGWLNGGGGVVGIWIMDWVEQCVVDAVAGNGHGWHTYPTERFQATSRHRRITHALLRKSCVDSGRLLCAPVLVLHQTLRFEEGGRRDLLRYACKCLLGYYI
jgi:hypothetical protein